MRQRSESEVEELVELARTCCEMAAAYRYAKSEGRLSATQEQESIQQLERLELRLELLKSNSELERCRAARRTNVIRFDLHRRKTAK